MALCSLLRTHTPTSAHRALLVVPPQHTHPHLSPMASKRNGGQGSNKTLPKSSSPEPPAVKKSKAKPGTNKSDGTTVGSKGKAPVIASGSSETAGPKRMTAQQLIGGPSWTGKLPQTLLYEHCVKSGWNKPEYTNVPYPPHLSTLLDLRRSATANTGVETTWRQGLSRVRCAGILESENTTE